MKQRPPRPDLQMSKFLEHVKKTEFVSKDSGEFKKAAETYNNIFLRKQSLRVLALRNQSLKNQIQTNANLDEKFATNSTQKEDDDGNEDARSLSSPAPSRTLIFKDSPVIMGGIASSSTKLNTRVSVESQPLVGILKKKILQLNDFN